MEDEKVLLKIYEEDDNVCVSFHIETQHDLSVVALALDDLIRKIPVLGSMLLTVRVARSIDKDLDEKIDSDSVEIPDFNKLLKDLN